MGSSSSLLNNLEKELECSTCLNTCTNPKTLPCTHSFCCHCLNELAEQSRENQLQIACPECRARIDLPHGSGFDSFPTACHLNRLKDIVSVQRQENQDDMKHLEEAAEAAKLCLKETEAEAQERADVLTKQVNRDNETRRKNQQQLKQTREAIQQNYTRLIELLKRHEQKLLTEVDAVEGDAEKNSKDQTEHLSKLNSLIEHLRSVRQRGISEVLKAEPSAMSQTQEVFDVSTNYQPLKIVHVEYKPDEDVSHRLENSPLGRVYSSLADTEKTQIEGPETKRILTEDCRVQVTPHTKGLHHRVTPPNNSLDTYVTKRRPCGYKAVATFGSLGSGKGQFRCPHGIAVSRAGEVAVSDCHNQRVQIFSADGQYLSEFGTKGTAEGQFRSPAGLAYNKVGHIVVADQDNSRIQVFCSSTGRWIRKFGLDVLKKPYGVSITSDDKMVVCDSKNETVNVFSPGGYLVLCFYPGSSPRSAIFFDEKYFVSVFRGAIKVFDSHGCHLYDVGQRSFNTNGLAVGTDDLLLVGNNESSCVKVYTLDGEFVTSFGAHGSGLGMFKCPSSLAVSSGGRVFVADAYLHNSCVQVFQAYT